MTPALQLAEIIKALDPAAVTALERAAFDQLRATIPGWSDLRHWVFFRSLRELWGDGHSARAILILGVYHGLDIAIMRAVGLKSYVVGVDKFSDTPCADWPAAWKDRSWATAAGCPAPTLERARECLRTAGAFTHTMLEESDDAVFLRQCPLKFDLIYLDTAHDRATVERQIRQVRAYNLLTTGGLLAGDDYDNLEPTWGVRDAVAAAGHHYLLSHRIWWMDEGALHAPAHKE